MAKRMSTGIGTADLLASNLSALLLLCRRDDAIHSFRGSHR